MLLSINKRDSAMCKRAWNSIHTINNPCLFFNRYVTVDLHVFQGQIWQSKQLVKHLFSDTFVSHIRVSALCLVLFVN